MRAGADLLRRWRSTPQSTSRGVPRALEDAWKDVAGETIGARSRPIGLNARGVMTVAVADSGWAHEITSRAEDLVSAMAQTSGGADVRSLRTRIADQVFLAAPEEEKAPFPPPGPAARRAAQEATAGISDPRLREVVERAAAAALSRGPSEQ